MTGAPTQPSGFTPRDPAEQRQWALLRGGDLSAAEPLLRACLRAQDPAGAEAAFGCAADAGLDLSARLRFAAMLGWCPSCARLTPGTFLMGHDEGQAPERPTHRVTLTRGFWLSHTPVTQGQWRAVMGNNPSKHKGDIERPVEQVSWYEAAAYCDALSRRLRLPGAYLLRDPVGGEAGAVDGLKVSRWRATFYAEVAWPDPSALGARLPTEAEWEYAASEGGRLRLTSPPSPALTRLLGPLDAPLPPAVPATPANLWGLHDMLGVVGEWCWDWFLSYEGFAVSDPTGPRRRVLHRAVRGGGRAPTGCPYPQRRRALSPSDCAERVGLRVAFTDSASSASSAIST
jgi:formylglycine-generating enzyme required for sulfatase activity